MTYVPMGGGRGVKSSVQVYCVLHTKRGGGTRNHVKVRN